MAEVYINSHMHTIYIFRTDTHTDYVYTITVLFCKKQTSNASLFLHRGASIPSLIIGNSMPTAAELKSIDIHLLIVTVIDITDKQRYSVFLSILIL